jgi:hypothetical protein
MECGGSKGLLNLLKTELVGMAYENHVFNPNSALQKVSLSVCARYLAGNHISEKEMTFEQIIKGFSV